MSGWAYNLIDLYISDKPNQLGETQISTVLWDQISLYGLMRGRPTLTPSTNNAQKQTIPGRPGELYSVVQQRSNAKLQFEILVADAWPFAALKAGDNPWLNNVFNRAYYIVDILNNAKRVSYKEPGKPATDYYEVISVTNEITDSDERAMLIKCTMEIFPFKFSFDGNEAHTIAANQQSPTTLLEWNLHPYSVCWPIFVSDTFSGSSYNVGIYVTCRRKIRGSSPVSFEQVSYGYVSTPQDRLNTFGPAISGKKLIIDTNKMQAYDNSSTPNPMNKYLSGDYDKVRFAGGCYIDIHNTSAVAFNIYTRRGIAV